MKNKMLSYSLRTTTKNIIPNHLDNLKTNKNQDKNMSCGEWHWQHGSVRGPPSLSLEVTSWTSIIQQRILCSIYKHVWETRALRHKIHPMGVSEQTVEGVREGQRRKPCTVQHFPPTHQMWYQWRVGIQSHWENQRGIDSNLVSVANTHWGWAQGQEQSSSTKGRSVTQPTSNE